MDLCDEHLKTAPCWSEKGAFHHSSFLAGGATLAAGRLVAENGNLKAIWAYSGHYPPTEESLKTFISFIEENGVNLKEIQRYFLHQTKTITMMGEENTPSEVTLVQDIPLEVAQERPYELVEIPGVGAGSIYQRTLSGDLHSLRPDLSPKAVLERINSKNATPSYQLRGQLSRKWSTGAGPRIGCVADYPPELRLQALEFVKLSPRLPPTPTYKQLANWSTLTCASPCDNPNF